MSMFMKVSRWEIMSKTPFSRKELTEFHKLLLTKKVRILQEIQDQKKNFKREESMGDIVDMATNLLEQEFNLSLTSQERKMLEEIDRAIERIENKTYGICVDTNEPIGKKRLKAMPEAKRTLKAQEAYEVMLRKKRKVGISGGRLSDHLQV